MPQFPDVDSVIAGTKRLSVSEALDLYHHADLTDLGRWATAVADRKAREAYGDQERTGAGDGPARLTPDSASLRSFVLDRNINYTNVCSAACTFCAFKRDKGEPDAYTLSTEQLHAKIAQLVAIGGTQILLQGGMHPDLPIDFYEDMLRGIKAAFPTVHVHGFSPPEVVEFIAVFKLDGFPTTAPGKSHELPPEVWTAKLEAILGRLMASGLDSIPGGGGEIFAPHVRRRIGIGKATADQWLAVMSAAHRLGMHTSATMMFGHIEGIADRIDHMHRIRTAQDAAISGGWPGRYTSFIAWPFQRENTPLGRVKEWDFESGQPFPGDVLAEQELRITEPRPPLPRGGIGSAGCPGRIPPHGTPGNGGRDTFKSEIRNQKSEISGGGNQKPEIRLRLSGATDYLRTQALARLFLDNVFSIGSSWVTMGPHIGQLALFFGASDMGSVMMEENVVSAAGTTYCLNEALLCHLIRDAGFTPAQRDNRYRLLKVHTGPDSPDLKVKDWSTQRVGKLARETGGLGNGNAVQVTVKAKSNR